MHGCITVVVVILQVDVWLSLYSTERQSQIHIMPVVKIRPNLFCPCSGQVLITSSHSAFRWTNTAKNEYVLVAHILNNFEWFRTILNKWCMLSWQTQICDFGIYLQQAFTQGLVIYSWYRYDLRGHLQLSRTGYIQATNEKPECGTSEIKKKMLYFFQVKNSLEKTLNHLMAFEIHYLSFLLHISCLYCLGKIQIPRSWIWQF